MECIELTINGKACTCEKGEFLLAVAQRNGIDIPTLCHHPALSEQGCCRVCIVEILENGRSKVVVSCVYPVEQSCEVYTDSPKIKEERSVILTMLKTRAQESTEIEAMCQAYGAFKTNRLVPIKGERCILCGLCTRACEALGTGAISTVNRGVTKKVATPYDNPPADCIGCTSCAQVCPTSAIEWSQNQEVRKIWGQKFALAKCKSCGKIISTKAELEYTAERNGTQAEYLCESCRKKSMADVLAHTYGVE